MDRANKDIRKAAMEKGVFLWEIAQVIGCNDGNFSRKLRKELSDSDKARIMSAIDAIAKNRSE